MFENRDLAKLTAMALGIGGGVYISPPYFKIMEYVFRDIRDASSRLRRYQRELQNLE